MCMSNNHRIARWVGVVLCVMLITGTVASAASIGWIKTGSLMLAKRDASDPVPIAGTSSVVKRLHFDEPTGKWFWMDFNSIKCADFDGSNVQTVVTDALTSANVDMDIDSVNGKIYWNNNNGQIRRCNFDGTALATIRSGLTAPYALAVDPINNKLFWTDYGGSNTNVYAGDLNANNPALIGWVSSLWLIADMDVDPVAQQVYWAGTSSFRAELIQRHGYGYSSSATTLINTEQGYIRSLKLDPTTGTMIMADASGGRILEANTNGTNLTVLYNGGAGTPLAAAVSSLDIPEPTTLALLSLGGALCIRRRRRR
jgi:hypothetical protein